MGKVPGRDGRLARAIFQEIPGQLSANSKRFKFSRTGKGNRFEECESALIWLEDASLVNVCRKCDDPTIGFKLHADETALKCYMADTGLLASLAFADGPESLEIYRNVQFGRVSMNRGMLVENVVAQQLVASGHVPMRQESLACHRWR